MKGGKERNLRISGDERDLQEIYIMFLSREIDIKSSMYHSTPEILRFYPMPPFIFPVQSL